VYGLPPINSSNFQILKAQGLTNNPHIGTWPDEVSLDVEWVHAAAPGAKIVLVVSPSNNALDEAINLAVARGLGNTISNSWSTVEGFGNPRGFDRVNRILMNAAAKGINVNFSSGDFGNNVSRVGFQTVDFPSSSPWATSVGGTSLGLNPDNTMAFQVGWGTNQTRIAEIATASGQAPTVPPLLLGFIFGAGGGSSTYYARPAFQAGLPVAGSTRVTPDVSMVADPFTGVEIIETDPATGQAFVGVIGGTSLACPLFSGVSALAAQKAGHGLGQVGATAYSIAASDPAAFYDVIPNPAVPSPTMANNVTGSTTVNGSTTNYSATSLVGPDPAITQFLSALYHGSSTRWYVLSFGTDTNLPVGPGWDFVTGLGTPNVPAFVNDLAK
jgi:subtilase family serine protease